CGVVPCVYIVTWFYGRVNTFRKRSSRAGRKSLSPDRETGAHTSLLISRQNEHYTHVWWSNHRDSNQFEHFARCTDSARPVVKRRPHLSHGCIQLSSKYAVPRGTASYSNATRSPHCHRITARS